MLYSHELLVKGMRTKKFKSILMQEIQSWVKEGIITPQQQRTLEERYESGVAIEDSSSKVIKIIVTIGSLLLGIGVILFFAANWQALPKFGKLLIIFSVIGASYAVGYILQFAKGNYPKTGGALIFLGCILYGSGIALIAQMYHMSVHYPNGILLWLVGVIPLAYAVRSRPILWAAVVGFLVWIGAELSLRIPRFQEEWLFALYFIVGVFLHGLGQLHERFSKTVIYSEVYKIVGYCLVIPVTFIFSFKEMGNLEWESPFILFAIGGGVLAFLIAQTLWVKLREGTLHYELLILGAILLCSFAFFINSDVFRVIFFNLLLFGECLGIVVYGLHTRKGYLVTIGLGFIGLQLVARYFDMFWRLMPRSIFFMVGGALLLVLGIYLEKRRRILMNRIRGG